MKRHLAIVGAILRKDILALWPLALPALVLLVVHVGWHDAVTPPFKTYLEVIASLVTGLLIVAVIHQDPIPSLQHDWLTKPVPAAAMVAAKGTFILASVLAPSMIGEAIAAQRSGYSITETLLVMTSIQWAAISTVLALSALAILTSTYLQVAGAIVGVILAAVLILPVTFSIAGIGEELYGTGEGWIPDQSRAAFAAIASIVLVWLQYWRRNTALARKIFVATVIALLISPAFFSWSTIFAVQKALSPDPAAAAAFKLQPQTGCFASMRVDPIAAGATPPDEAYPEVHSMGISRPMTSEVWPAEWRLAAGAGAIGFSTSVIPEGIPAGWKLITARVEAVYVKTDGRVLHKLRTARFMVSSRSKADEALPINHHWLLPRPVYERLESQSANLQLDYSFSLLQPVVSAEIVADGLRRHLSGLGYCSAVLDRSSARVKVGCYKRGAQPALLTAQLAGASDSSAVASDWPSYTPAAFEFLGGKQHAIELHVPAMDEKPVRVKLTAFDARAHFSRQVTSPGILGGPPEVCPVPKD